MSYGRGCWLECEELDGVDWHWQAADCCMNKSRFDGEKRGPNPTDRAKPGTKKSLIVEHSGGPLGLEIAGANVHDSKLLQATIEAIVVERPDPNVYRQHLLLDKGYDRSRNVDAVINAAGYIPHIRRIGEEKLDSSSKRQEAVSGASLGRRAHARVAAEVPGDSIRYDKKAENYLGLMKLACALLWFRRLFKLEQA
jgi:putative transposase